MLVLGIESSCDETAAAVVQAPRKVLSNVISCQVALHALHGGVVPELASRAHVEALPTVVRQAVDQAGVAWSDIDAVAATRGPGLAGSLLVGFNAAKGLALRLRRPLIAVNHIEAHMLSALLDADTPAEEDRWPCLSLVVSGGHTLLYRMEGMGNYRLLGRTLDDAAGEALDKAALRLGLEYPGGPAIERAARGVLSAGVRFPRGRPKSDNPALNGLRADCCWSFSGLKTALVVHLERHPPRDVEAVAALCFDYQEAVVDALAGCCARAHTDERTLLVGGGVSLNNCLRERLAAWCAQKALRWAPTPAEYCGDNAAMIAAAAAWGVGIRGEKAMDLDVQPSLWLMERSAVQAEPGGP